MGEIQNIDHTVIAVTDLEWAEWFYTEVLGGEISSRQGLTTDQLIRAKRRREKQAQELGGVRVPAPHSSVALGESVVAMFIYQEHVQEPPPDHLRGTPRVAYEVSRQRFQLVLDALKEAKIPFAGPVRHPEALPLGESIYFKDPSSNFIELCWAREPRGKHGAGKSRHS
jgi:catechol 2,3-dioxygenase-like lactoylglutathione lyase family enzyme